MLCTNVTHKCYTPMLCINVEMNMGGTWKTWKNSKLHFRWRGLLVTIYHLVSHLGWQPLPEITNMAIITHRVSLRIFQFDVFQVVQFGVIEMVQFGVFKMVQFPDGSV